MSYRRLSLTQVLSDQRTERLARTAPTAFVVDGRFDLAAIMRRAVQVARGLRAGGKSWSWRMGGALRTVWGWAKHELLAPVAAPLPPAPPAPSWVTDREPRAPRARPTVFLRGSRVHSHGW